MCMPPPKQKGKVKEQLKYIGRPAIALGRIEEYDGLFLTFKYMDKTDGKEKREKNNGRRVYRKTDQTYSG